jgi:cytosine permease
MLIPFLILLGSIIPPIGGVIVADFFYGHKGLYPKLSTAALPRFNWVGLSAYAIGALCAYFSPWVAPLVGIAVAALSYVLLFELQRMRITRQVTSPAQA